MNCTECNDALLDYDEEDDIGWCAECRLWITDNGDYWIFLCCPSCRGEIDLDREHRPLVWEVDRGTLDEPCGTCQNRHHPSLTNAERNR
jgi:uncharacterized protein YbaR (Trm112 family)